MFSRIQSKFIFISILLLVVSGLTWSCRPTAAKPQQQTFLDAVQRLSKKKYNGLVVYPAGREAPFQGKKIVLEVGVYSKNQVRMPIVIGDKVYRTLILGRDENGFWLQHENKRSDGTQAEISMYGGHAEDSKSPFLLVFPADGYTRQLLGAERKSSWSLGFSSDKTTLSYMAESDGRLDLQLDFDLTTPLP